MSERNGGGTVIEEPYRPGEITMIFKADLDNLLDKVAERTAERDRLREQLREVEAERDAALNAYGDTVRAALEGGDGE